MLRRGRQRGDDGAAHMMRGPANNKAALACGVQAKVAAPRGTATVLCRETVWIA
jgi:hypothetical protein